MTKICFGDVFSDPDSVGQSEYRAIHDCIIDAVFNGNPPDGDTPLTEDQIHDIRGMLCEFADWVEGMKMACQTN